MPAYVVFTDNTLIAIAEMLPDDDAALIAIPGIGARKLEQYGPDVLDLVRRPLQANAQVRKSVVSTGRYRLPSKHAFCCRLKAGGGQANERRVATMLINTFGAGVAARGADRGDLAMPPTPPCRRPRSSIAPPPRLTRPWIGAIPKR